MRFELSVKLLRAFCFACAALLVVLAIIAAAGLVLPLDPRSLLEESFKQFDSIFGTPVYIPELIALGLAHLSGNSASSVTEFGPWGTVICLVSAAGLMYLGRQVSAFRRWPSAFILLFNGLSILASTNRTVFALSSVLKGEPSDFLGIVFVVGSFVQYLLFVSLFLLSLKLLSGARRVSQIA